MKAKKLNNLTYEFHFNTDTEAANLFHYLYEASERLCESRDCEDCILVKDCCNYWKVISAFIRIADKDYEVGQE